MVLRVFSQLETPTVPPVIMTQAAATCTLAKDSQNEKILFGRCAVSIHLLIVQQHLPGEEKKIQSIDHDF